MKLSFGWVLSASGWQTDSNNDGLPRTFSLNGKKPGKAKKENSSNFSYLFPHLPIAETHQLFIQQNFPSEAEQTFGLSGHSKVSHLVE